jgi:tRNA(Glu) U13 pseudouridine synthase TruD
MTRPDRCADCGTPWAVIDCTPNLVIAGSEPARCWTCHRRRTEPPMTLAALITEARSVRESGLPEHFGVQRFARVIVALGDLLEDGDALDAMCNAWLDSEEAGRRALVEEMERRMAEMERAEMALAETEEGS